VAGQVAGIVGYGDVGRAVAHRAKALGMTVLGLCRRPRRGERDPSADEVMGEQQLSELMSRSDYVVVAAPLTEATRGMLGKSELEAMKPSAVLVNIGRGAVVDEPALIELLQLGRIRGAALDVFETEPLPEGHPFYRMENVLLSPHSADHTQGDTRRSVRLFLDNFERYRRGEPLLNLVDKRQGY
jgi:phosphoglycerate dehydrogenase-like enzyme